ncbi:MAG: signal peptidase I [Parcubacteria group bacterium]|nr:signal peptidase I [Parcubacteria group bacterium]
MQKFKKIASRILTGLLIALAVVLVVPMLPIPGNFQIRVVQSGSMEPAIKTGSVVLIKPLSNYKIGDVITFEGNFKDAKGKKIPTTHRITDAKVDVGTISYQTKGDANDDIDRNLVSANKVIGKVLVSVPYAGYLVAGAKTGYGLLAIVVIPAALIIFDQVGKIVKEIKKSKNAQKIV